MTTQLADPFADTQRIDRRALDDTQKLDRADVARALAAGAEVVAPAAAEHPCRHARLAYLLAGAVAVCASFYGFVG